MMRSRNGFTLVEAMVAVAVLAILALLAIPGYQNRIIREQILEATPLTDLSKKQVVTAWTATHVLPVDNAAAALPVPEKMVNNFVSAVSIEAGAIHVTFGNRANKLIQGKVLTLRPAIVDDAPIVPIVWVCGYAPAPQNMSAKGENRTNIPPNYLPLNCQAG